MKRKDSATKMQDTATALAEKVRDAKLDERAADFAALAREKVRDAKLDERAAALAALAREKVRDAQLDERAAELATTARNRAKETGLEDWVIDIIARVRDSALAQEAADTASQVAESARGTADRTLDAVGEWLEDTPVGDRLGIRRKRRRLSPWSVAVAGGLAAIGVAVSVMSRRRAQSSDDDIWGGDTGASLSYGTSTTATGSGLPLEERVREAIGQDPRTAELSSLNVNVVDGTVFVRGTVGEKVDQDVLRVVIEGVEGVTDVDLQVTASA